MIVNTGGYRRTKFVFEKFINGLPVFSGGFPIVLNILESFAQYPALTEEEFILLSDAQYQERLSGFYSYLALQYSFFDPLIHIPSGETINSHGTDLDFCPIDLPSLTRNKMFLEVAFRTELGERFAEISVRSVNHEGSPYFVSIDTDFEFLLKEQSGIIGNWDLIESIPITGTILQGQDSVVVVPEFRYRTETENETKSVKVRLLPFDDESDFGLGEPDTVIVSHTDSSFLFNYVSNTDQAYQDMVPDNILQSMAANGEGLILSPKSNRIFNFISGQPGRPVYMYPKSWGMLTEVLFVQENNINILFDGAFLFNNGSPYEITLNINNENIEYYVYASAAMIIYPYPVEYNYFFGDSFRLEPSNAFTYTFPITLL